MLHALATSVPVFLVIGIGWLLRRLKVLGAREAQALSGIGYYVGLPALLFHSISGMRLEGKGLLLGLAAVLAAYIASMTTSLVIIRIMRLTRPQAVTFTLLNSNGNHAYVALPILEFAYGGDATAIGAYLTGMLGVWFSVLTLLVRRIFDGKEGSSGRWNVRSIGSELIRNPLMVAVLLGLAFNLSGLRLPLFADRSLVLLKQLAAPAGLLSVGLSMNVSAIRKQLPIISTVVVVKLMLTSLFAYWAFTLLGAGELMLKAGVVLLSAPSAATAYLIAKMLGGDEELAANSIAITTAASLITMTLILSWLG